MSDHSTTGVTPALFDGMPPHDPTADLAEQLEPGAVARNTDPLTSHQAAASVDVTKGQQRVLDALALRPDVDWTDEQFARWFEQRAMVMKTPVGMSPSGLRTRRAELIELGLIEWTGDKRPLASGRLSQVWRLA